MVEIFIDSKTMQILEANPIEGAEDPRYIVDVGIPNGMPVLEALSTLDGWIGSFKRTQAPDRNTVLRVRIG